MDWGVGRIAPAADERYLLHERTDWRIAEGHSMSSDKPPPSDTAGRRGARRPARTIELKADEIASSPVADAPSETQEGTQQPAEPAATAPQASEAPAAAHVIVEEPSVQSAEPVSLSSGHTDSVLPDTDTSGANPPPPPSGPSL